MLESLLRKRRIAFQRSGDVDVLRSALTSYFPGHLLELGPQRSNFRAQFSLLPLSKVLLFHGTYRGSLHIYVPDSHYFLQGFPIRGSGEVVNNRIAMTTSPERGSLGEPGEISFVTSSDFEHVVALLDPDALSKTIAVLTGISGIGRLKLNRTDFGSRPATRVSRCLVKMLIEEPDAADLLSPLVIEELEHAILVAFVSGNRHNYSHLLDRQVADAAPWQIRRVEEYIEANWDQPLTIEAMAVIANASARSIFSSFRAHCGYTPMHFVKKLRLEHAREMLASGDSEMTVTNAAFACGFGNLGHFAHDYQRMLGELPSATLRRARNVPNRQPRRGALSFTPDCSQVLPPSNNDPVVVGWPKSSNIGIDRFR